MVPGTFTMVVPEPWRAAYESGALVHDGYGSLVSRTTGKYAAHLVQGTPLPNSSSLLQVGSMLTAGIGIGVSVIGFALLSRRFKKGIGEVRNDVRDLRNEIGGVRNDIGRLQAAMQGEFAALRDHVARLQMDVSVLRDEAEIERARRLLVPLELAEKALGSEQESNRVAQLHQAIPLLVEARVDALQLLSRQAYMPLAKRIALLLAATWTTHSEARAMVALGERAAASNVLKTNGAQVEDVYRTVVKELVSAEPAVFMRSPFGVSLTDLARWQSFIDEAVVSADEVYEKHIKRHVVDEGRPWVRHALWSTNARYVLGLPPGDELRSDTTPAASVPLTCGCIERADGGAFSYLVERAATIIDMLILQARSFELSTKALEQESDLRLDTPNAVEVLPASPDASRSLTLSLPAAFVESLVVVPVHQPA